MRPQPSTGKLTVCSERMRVIAGQFRSRVLVAPPGTGTRPTSDRLRETLFNVLGPRVQGSRFADLYAGSGAVGIEALSRGATLCLFAERGPAALSAIQRNLAALKPSNSFRIEAGSVARALSDAEKRSERFDLVFLDPPYEAETEYSATLGFLGEEHRSLLAPDALVIAEHARRSALPQNFGRLVQRRLLEQGDAALSFYSVLAAASSE